MIALFLYMTTGGHPGQNHSALVHGADKSFYVLEVIIDSYLKIRMNPAFVGLFD